MTSQDFILDFQKQSYPYLEEVNEGIIKQIKPTLERLAILDVGAGRGVLGKALRERGYEVYAIESDANIAAEASTNVDHVICADLCDMHKVSSALKQKKFKYIIFSDVLEHVFDPLQVLRHYLAFLDESGKILVSLPNAVNWLNRIRFMMGSFNYEMTGVMDRTHVRFFTFHSAKKMLEASSCVVEKMDSTPFIVRAFLPFIKTILNNAKKNMNTKSIVESPYYQLYIKYLYPLEYWISRVMPSLFSFRIIIVARKPE